MGLVNWWLARTEAAHETQSSNYTKKTSKLTRTMEMLKVTRSSSNGKKKVNRKCLPLSPTTQEPSKITKPSPTPQQLSVTVSQVKVFLHQYKSAVSLYPSLVHSIIKPKLEEVEDEVPVSVSGMDNFWVASEALLAFESKIDASIDVLKLQMTSDGCGGAYFVHNQEDKTVGIFKPRDEEYMAPKNPRGYVQEHAIVGETEHPVNKGFRVGNGALRERAAFLLDEAYNNFSGVPVTSVTTLPVDGIMKEGSVQAFVESECSAEDMGSLKFTIPEVHKIGILDVRLFNTDRHAGNILLSRSSKQSASFTLTPIDHGFCLPSFKHLDGATFDWLQWSQAQYPFTCEELEHIDALDVSRDASILRSLGIEEECITTMRITTSLLRIGADAGFSLYEIGSCLQREGDFSRPSRLETIVTNAVATLDGMNDKNSVAYMDALVVAAETAVTSMFDEQPKKKVRSISCFT